MILESQNIDDGTMRFGISEPTIRGNTTLTINDLATSEFHDKED